MTIARRMPTSTLMLVVAISIIGGFILGYVTGFKYGAGQNEGPIAAVSNPQAQPAVALNPVLAPKVEEIVKELNCVCGCKMRLAPCTCDEQKGSKEIKDFVQMMVQQGASHPDVVKSLVERYGEGVLIKKT